jgi:hypothetical protein
LLLLFLREGGMSVSRLLLSGLLIASGIILGAFTLRAMVAPEWKVQASAVVRPYAKPKPADTHQESDRAAAADVPDNWAARLVKAPDPKPAPPTDAKAAEAKKKLAEKQKPKQEGEEEEEESQTVLSWLQSLLNDSP